MNTLSQYPTLAKIANATPFQAMTISNWINQSELTDETEIMQMVAQRAIETSLRTSRFLETDEGRYMEGNRRTGYVETMYFCRALKNRIEQHLASA